MSDVTQEHEEKGTFSVDVEVPGHPPRKASALFERTRKELLAKTPRCWVCNRTAEEAGQPLEAHHMGVEYSFMTAPIDWDIVAQDFPNFEWSTFDPAHPETFVDDMNAQGLVLCKEHHTHPETGIHTVPYPIYRMQRYLKSGYKFNDLETIVHEDLQND